MNAKEIERAAYVAAHRVLAADTSAHELACPGARKSRAIAAVLDRHAPQLMSRSELHFTHLPSVKPPIEALNLCRARSAGFSLLLLAWVTQEPSGGSMWKRPDSPRPRNRP